MARSLGTDGGYGVNELGKKEGRARARSIAGATVFKISRQEHHGWNGGRVLLRTARDSFKGEFRFLRPWALF